MAIVKKLQGGTADTKKVCGALAYSKGWPTTCCKPIKVIRDGVGYCGIHDPQHQAAMQRKRDEKNSAK